MLAMILKDGTYHELPGAKTATIEDGEVVCRNAEGAIVERLSKYDVGVYGRVEIVLALAQKLARLDGAVPTFEEPVRPLNHPPAALTSHRGT